jgi:hypothetical protein
MRTWRASSCLMTRSSATISGSRCSAGKPSLAGSVAAVTRRPRRASPRGRPRTPAPSRVRPRPTRHVNCRPGIRRARSRGLLQCGVDVFRSHPVIAAREFDGTEATISDIALDGAERNRPALRDLRGGQIGFVRRLQNCIGMRFGHVQERRAKRHIMSRTPRVWRSCRVPDEDLAGAEGVAVRAACRWFGDPGAGRRLNEITDVRHDERVAREPRRHTVVSSAQIISYRIRYYRPVSNTPTLLKERISPLVEPVHEAFEMYVGDGDGS